jgi:hypothetical protein
MPPTSRLLIALIAATIPVAASALPDVCDAFGRISAPTALSNADVTIGGVERNQSFGFAVANLGDINADGHEDLAIGAPGTSLNGPSSGAVYLFYGPVTDPAALSAAQADAVLLGSTSFTNAGWSVQGVGDVDQDGRDDFVVGSTPGPRAADRRGTVWLMLGGDVMSGWLDLDTEAEAVLHGSVAGSEFGASVSGGDLNDDGFADLLVGAPGASTAAAEGGAAYVFFGPVSGDLDAASADRSYTGRERKGRFGTSVSVLGDVDGDGVGDFAAGAPRSAGNGNNSGATYVFYGSPYATGAWNADDADLLIRGGRNERMGSAVAAAGDIDGDGLQDFWAGAKQYGSTKRGAAYLFLGGDSSLYGVLADHSFASRIRGHNANDLLGSSIARPADFDNDGHADLLVGAERGDGLRTQSGAAWVVHGPLLGLDHVVSPNAGQIQGETGLSFAGASVASFGDLNGDGFSDALVGAWRADVTGATRAGKVGLVFGGHDVADLRSWHADTDGDGYGDATAAVLACAAPDDHVADALDCNDSDDRVHPYAPEASCSDPTDYNCDGSVGPADADGDGVNACGGDCNDSNVLVGVGLPERCGDDLDNDCDGRKDEADAVDALAWYPDYDGDGFGNTNYPHLGCAAPAFVLVAQTTTAGDCNDFDAAIRPGATEVCDALDNDCDGRTDDRTAADASSFFADLDQDGFGDAASSVLACVAPAGFVHNRDDCDDDDAVVRPGAAEVCDALDNDCDGLTYLGGPVSSSDFDLELFGAHETEKLGSVVAWMPDTNGDGRAEVVAAGPAHNARLADGTTVTNAGAIYLRYGRPELLSASLDELRTAGQTWWDARIVTDRANSFLGEALVGGDFNGDGVGDLAVAAPSQSRPNLRQGAVFVFYGPVEGDLTTLDADVVFSGVGGYNYFGYSLAADDTDGDGMSDLLIGAIDADGASSRSGAAYLVYGGAFGAGGRIDQVSAASISGDRTDADLGWSVDFAGDLNQDGFQDLAFGAPNGGPAITGSVTVSYGGPNRFSGALPASRVVLGAATGDRFGLSVAGLGDLDGDGVDELAVGSLVNSAWVLGDLPASTASISVSAIADVTFSAPRGAGFGQRVARAGDTNGDGLADLLISASDDDEAGRNAGAVYLIYGATDLPASVPASRVESAGRTAPGTDFPTFSYTNIGGVHGARVLGATVGEQLGHGMAGGYDVDGDGYDDLLLGGPKADDNRGRAVVMRAGAYGTDVPSHAVWSRPLTVDGHNNEWIDATRLTTSMTSASANLTWDSEKVYFGYDAPEVSSGSPSARMVLYLGTEGVWGSTLGKHIGGQQPTLPFAASYVVTWRSDGQESALYGVDGDVWYPITGAMQLVANPAAGVLELALDREALGLHSTLDVAAWWTFHDAAMAVSYAAVPAGAFEEFAVDPDPIAAVSVSLLSSASPNSVNNDLAFYASQSEWLWDRDTDGHGDNGARGTEALQDLGTDETTFLACPLHVPMVFPNPDRTAATDEVRMQGLADLSLSSDCDDLDADRYVGAPETPGDGVDSNCDGADGGDNAAVPTAWTTTMKLYTNDVAQVFASYVDPDAGTDLERPVTLQYSWFVNGVRVSGAEGPTLDGALYFDKGQAVRAEVRAFDGVVTSQPAVVNFNVLNSLPVVTECNVDVGASTMWDDVWASAVVEDADGDPVTVSYDWAGTGTVHKFDGDPMIPAGWAGHGNFVWTMCKPHDGTRWGVMKPSSASYIVDPTVGDDLNTAGNDAPIMLSIELTPEQPTDDDDLHAVAVAYDPDGDEVTMNLSWRRNTVGMAWDEELETPWVTDIATADLHTWGDTLRVFGRPCDYELCGEQRFDRVRIGVPNTPPTARVDLDPNRPTTGTTMVALATSNDLDLDLVTLTYDWFIDGQQVAGEHGTTLDGSYAFSGSTIEVAVTPFDGFDFGPTVYDEAPVVDHTNTPPVIQHTGFTQTTTYYPGMPITVVTQATDPENDPLTLTHTWTVNNQPVVGVTGPTLPGGSYHGGNTIKVTVHVHDGGGAPTTTTLVVVAGNHLPVIDAVTLTPHAPYPNEDVTATVVAHDPDGDPLTTTYAWTVNGTPVAPTTPTLPHTYFDSDDEIEVTVVVSDDHSDSAPATEQATVDNHPPVLGPVTLTPASPGTTQNVTASAAATDEDGDTVTLTYAWDVNGQHVPGVSAPTLPHSHFDATDVVTVTVTADDGHDSSAPGTASATVLNAPPVIDGVTLNPPAPFTNQPVTAAVALHDDDGHPLTLTYTWSVDGVTVPGATGPTLPHTHYHVADVVQVTVVANDGFDNSNPGTATATVANHPPVVESVLLTPQGPLPTTDVTANVAVSDDDGDTVTLTYAWSVDGSPVHGVTTDTLHEAHYGPGQLITVLVTPFDGFATGTPGTDSTTVQTPNGPPVIDDLEIVPGSPAPTDDLVADVTASDPDGDVVSISYTWTIDGVTVPGVNTDTLPETYLFGGEVVTVTATPHDGTQHGAPAVDTVTVSVPNSPPVIESLVTNPADVWPWTDVLAVAVASDPDGDVVTITYQWFVDGVEAPAALDDLLTENYLDGGELVEVFATPFDGEDYGATVSTSVTVGVPNTPPTIDECVVAPVSPNPSQYVQGTVVAHDDDGDALVLTKVWYVNGVEVLSGADSLPPTYYTAGSVITLVCIADDGLDPVTDQDTVTVTTPTCPTWNSTNDVTYSVCGVVTDHTGAPVSDASVKIEYRWNGNVVNASRTADDGTYCVTGILMTSEDYPTVRTYNLVVSKPGFTDQRIASGSSTFLPAACARRLVNTSLSPISGYSECYTTDFETSGAGAWTAIEHNLSAAVGVKFQRLAYDPAAPLLNEAAGRCTLIPPDEDCEIGAGCHLCDPSNPSERGCTPVVNAVPAPLSGNHSWWFGRVGASRGDYSVGNFNGTGGTCLPEGTYTSTDWGSGTLIPAPGGGWLLPVGGNGGFSRVTTTNSTNWVLGSTESPAITLPSGSSPTLQFSAWYDVESVDPQKPDNGGYDHVKVHIRRPGQTNGTYLGAMNPEIDADGRPGEAYSSGGLNRAPVWATYSFDLSAYAGQTVYVQFIVYSKDAKYNAFRGAGFDDVRIFDENNGCN